VRTEAIAILSSTVIGYLCVIAAAISPDTIFLFLLNSSGAVILFAYLLIAVSQVVLRRRTTPDKLIVKMWFYPVLSIATIAAILAVLAQMYLQEDVHAQLLMSLLVWAITLAVYAILRWKQGSAHVVHPAKVVHQVNRMLVFANKTVEAAELLDELQRIDAAGKAKHFVCAPADFVDTRAAELTGAVWVEETSIEAARHRLAAPSRRFEAKGCRPREASVTACRCVLLSMPSRRSARTESSSPPTRRTPPLVAARHRQAGATGLPGHLPTHVIARLPVVLV